MLREIVHIKMEGPEADGDLPECVFDEWRACSEENRTNLIDFLMASEHQSRRRAGVMLHAIIESEEAEVAWLADAERGSTYDVLDTIATRLEKAYPTDDGAQKTALAAKAVLQWMGEDEPDPPQEVGIGPIHGKKMSSLIVDDVIDFKSADDTTAALSQQLRDSLLKAFPSTKVPVDSASAIALEAELRAMQKPEIPKFESLPCGHSIILMTATGCSGCKSYAGKL